MAARAISQPFTGNEPPFSITVLTSAGAPAIGASITLLRSTDSTSVKDAVTDSAGIFSFDGLATGSFYFTVNYTGYRFYSSPVYTFPPAKNNIIITLQPATNVLNDVTVSSQRKLIQRAQGKTVINVEAAATNAGTSVLEVLEKSPGVTVDKDGNVSMQGKTGVLIMIDDKPTYLQGTELANLLGSMSSGQVDQIELMPNPPAKYDATGNAGIINIKTKKNKQKGFNATLNMAPGIGRYPKANNSIAVNYRNAKWNAFLTYSLNYNKSYTSLYALRKYYGDSSKLLSALEQPTLFKGKSLNNTVKAGIDYYLSSKTTIGVAFTGSLFNRSSNNIASATWMDASGTIDSTINTNSSSSVKQRNGWININFRHSISKTQEISADIDAITYDITNRQEFANTLQQTGGYREETKGYLPSSINILAAKADYTVRFQNNNKLESGLKSSYISTDNIARYEYKDSTQWQDDLGKSNHFLYRENINALYSSYEQKWNRLTMQAGLRYEYTSYKAHQLGNAVNKDSSFSRNYHSLFPSGYISYQADSNNSFTLTAGRRIDRPAFQRLNPFVFIINKYTYERGNPFFLPQYSWNMELSHQYKQWLTTAVSYSIINNYFSQLFLTEGSEILIYTEGNVGRMYNAGLSVTVQTAPFKWWSLTGQAVANYKKLKGYVWNTYTSSIKQLNVNINNQFRINQTLSAELSGFYTSRARNDLQELLYPTGQVSVGIAKSVFKNKGSLKLSMRDIFHTQVMEGLTDFEHADEYFIIHRDSRVLTLAFTYRFGKAIKATKRSSGGAEDEIQRVGG